MTIVHARTIISTLPHVERLPTCLRNGTFEVPHSYSKKLFREWHSICVSETSPGICPPELLAGSWPNHHYGRQHHHHHHLLQVWQSSNVMRTALLFRFQYSSASSGRSLVRLLFFVCWNAFSVPIYCVGWCFQVLTLPDCTDIWVTLLFDRSEQDAKLGERSSDQPAEKNLNTIAESPLGALTGFCGRHWNEIRLGGREDGRTKPKCIDFD